MRIRSTFSSLAAFILTAGLVASCQTSSPGHAGSATPPVLDPSSARGAGLSEQDVAGGNALYITKCARCHKFYHPADYSDVDWQNWMTKMSRKAKLDPDQDQLLRRYLGAFRTAGAVPAR